MEGPSEINPESFEEKDYGTISLAASKQDNDLLEITSKITENEAKDGNEQI